MNSRKLIKAALLGFVSVASLAAAFYAVGTQTLVQSLNAISLSATLTAALLILISTLLAFLRFRSVLLTLGYRTHWRDALLAFAAGQLSNQFLLNVIGQSLSRAAALTHAGIPFGASVIATYWERIIAAGLLFLLSLIAAFYLFLHIDIDLHAGGAYLLALLATMAIVAGVVMVVFLRNADFRSSLWVLPLQILRFWPAALLTFASHAATAVAYAVLLAGLDQPDFTLGVFAALTIVMFTASLPISFAGWGIREFSAVHALAVVGISSGAAVTAAVVIGLLSMAITFAGGGLGLLLFIQRRQRPKLSPVPVQAGVNVIDHERWLSLAATGAAILSALLLFFQIRIPNTRGEITANASDILSLTGLGLILMLAWTHRSFRPLPRWLIAALAAISLVLVMGLGVGWLYFDSNSWALINRSFGWLIILGYVSLGALLAMIPQKGVERQVLLVFALSGVTIAALQLALFAYSLFVEPLPADAFALPLSGYSVNANAFAFQMIMTAAVIVVAHRIRLAGERPLLYLAAILIVFVAIYYSLSRAGIGMMIILMILAVACAPARDRRHTLVAAASVCATYALLLAIPAILACLQQISISLPIFGSSLSLSDLSISINTEASIYLQPQFVRSVSDNEHWLTVIQGWNLWLKHPFFGNGLGSYVEYRVNSGQEFQVIHSIPVWLLAETGVVGFAVLAAAMIRITKHAFDMMRDPHLAAWGLGLLIILACLSAAGFVHDFFFQRQFWFLIGLFIAVSARANTARS